MTDASGQGLGAVLAEVFDGQEHPIAFASRQLNEAKRRYGATEQECLGVEWAVRHFRCYLFGRHFRDCNALKRLMSVGDPNSRLARWNLLLQEHSFEIVHRAGKWNQNADALSRAVVRGLGDFRPRLDLERFRQEQRNDDELVSWITQCQNTPGRHSEYYLDNEGLLCQREGYWATKPETSRDRDVVPVSLRNELLRTTPDGPYDGHLGARKTTERLSRDYYWLYMKQDVKVHCDRCGSCSLRKTPKGRKPAPLQIFEEVSKPFQRTSMEIMGPLPLSTQGNRYLPVLVEHLSR